MSGGQVLSERRGIAVRFPFCRNLAAYIRPLSPCTDLQKKGRLSPKKPRLIPTVEKKETGRI